MPATYNPAMQRRTQSLVFLVPHAFTFLRLPLAVAFFLLFRNTDAGALIVCLALLGAAIASDYLDGMLARRLHTVGTFGKWADPLCDAAFFFAVYGSFYRAGIIPLALLLLFVARESVQYALIRPLSLHRGIDTGARFAGKLKTGLQMAGSAAVIILWIGRCSGLVGATGALRASIAIVTVLVSVSLASLYAYVLPLFSLDADGRLASSIVATLVAHCVVNTAAVATVSPAVAVAIGLPVLIAIATAYHAVIAAFLLLRRGDLSRGVAVPADRLNLPCHLTLARISSAPAFGCLIATAREPAWSVAILLVLCLVFLTDLVDGKLARAMNLGTFMGRYLDPVSDYVLLFATVAAAWVAGAVAPWYLAVFAARFTLFPVGMGLLSWKRGRVEPESTLLGKVAVFAAMAALAFQLCRAFGLPFVGEPRIVTGVEVAAAAILVVSLGEKAVYLARRFLRPV